MIGLYTAVSVTLLVGLGVCFLSVVHNSVSGLSAVSLRVLAERANGTSGVLASLSRDPRHFLLPIEFGIQVLQVIGAVLVTVILAGSGLRHPYLLSVGLLILAVYLFRQLLPRLITQHNPERVLLGVLPVIGTLHSILRWISWPLSRVLTTAEAKREKWTNGEEEYEEPSEEEIQAFLNVGEEEGIIEKEESELIQSALEFGSTLVREIMTPRSEIVAIEEKCTIADLRDLFVSSRHSRIPVYRDRLDDIVGIAYVKHLLAAFDPAHEDDTITQLLLKPWFVPETKRVAELLKEMQANAEHLAIVINEYGAVAGLVTIEDLVEEIVGEIRDEDELRRVDLTYEGDGNYIVRGGVSLEEVEEALGVEFGEQDVTTISGLVVLTLNRVPVAGETMTIDGLEVEVLSADRRRIHTMRVRRVAQPETAGSQLT
ncbi:MAG: hemolysin family protein [Acidobacteriota bacterium]